MRVLVTGGAGFVGSHACKALSAEGHDPIVYDNLRTGHAWAVKWGPFHHGDLFDTARLVEVMRTEKVDAVMHFAALAYVGESVARPDIYYRTNVAGTLSLLSAMQMAGVGEMVFSSTCATYGIAAETPIVETTPQSPINPYGRSKLMVEDILTDYASAFDIGATVLRYFNAAGSDPEGEIGEEHDPETHLVPLVLKAAAGEIPAVPVLGDDWPTPDGTCVRDYIHVCDLADAHSKALSVVEAGQVKTFNLGTGQGFSVREVIDTVARVTGRSVPSKIAPRRPGDPPVLTASSDAAHKALGWSAKRGTLEEMIESAWAWMVEHRTRVRLTSVLEQRNDRRSA
ncbi:MAG: UDP-glucose 4-epimerase GalE [Pseudomonadota bacterium]